MYETFYKLSGKPFQLSPDPSFYFASKGHSRAYAYLKYGIYQGEGFIVITGDIGAGKTTLVQALLSEIDSSKIVAAQLVSTQLQDDELLAAVADAFGLVIKDSSKAEILAKLRTFLTSLAAEQRRALLIVDEAQNLTRRAIEELRMLSNFQIGSHALLQSFLVGQPELNEILREASMKPLRQRIIASYHLGPMDREETKTYVLHRLLHVHWKNDPKIEEPVFDRLYEVTDGLPRMINAMCNRLFLKASLDRKHLIGVDELAKVLEEVRDEIGIGSQQEAPRESPAEMRAATSPAVTARLGRIEKGVGTAVDLLQQIAKQEGKTISARAPKPRSHFGGARVGSSPRRAGVTPGTEGSGGG